MAKCKICNTYSNLISNEIGICLNCIRQKPDEAIKISYDVHRKSRIFYGLPDIPPKDTNGKKCNICFNECQISENQIGYCGLRKNINNKLTGVSSDEGKLSWYHDPLPTNCVADWVCAGGTGAGYPDYAYSTGPEKGFYNLAVFFHACTINCLYCQNWHFKKETLKEKTTNINKLIADITDKTSCICYFGGDPTPQLPFAIKSAKLSLEKKKGKILRICWETNGTMNKTLLNEMIELSLKSGGCIKFDLKAWDKNLHKVLTGSTNESILENFQIVSKRIKERPIPPLLIASTLLVPGYIDENEIRNISRFIASLNPDIPYCLLAFYPHFYMSDMPLTKRELAFQCLRIAKDEGLNNVRLGNLHLLI